MDRKSGPKHRRASLAIPLSLRPVAKSEHFTVEHDTFHNIVRVTRTSDSYPSAEALREAHDWLQKVFANIDRASVVLVWDGRRGKLRNDPEFEAAIKAALPAVTAGWCEFISINSNSAVKLQFSRWTRDGTAGPIVVFTDEQEALKYALGVSQGGPQGG